MKRALLLILITSAAAAGAAGAAGRGGDLSHLRPRHRAVLGRWLAGRGWLRPAAEADCHDRVNLALMRRSLGRAAHPYYSVADFNRDGHEDFAVVLLVRGKEEAALAIFNGPFGRAAAPAYFERGFQQHPRMYIAYDYTVERHLFLGVYEGDYYCLTLIPKGRTYADEDCLADIDPDTTEGATPGHR